MKKLLIILLFVSSTACAHIDLAPNLEDWILYIRVDSNVYKVTGFLTGDSCMESGRRIMDQLIGTGSNIKIACARKQ